jgi:hypothetical protein
MNGAPTGIAAPSRAAAAAAPSRAAAAAAPSRRGGGAAGRQRRGGCQSKLAFADFGSAQDTNRPQPLENGGPAAKLPGSLRTLAADRRRPCPSNDSRAQVSVSRCRGLRECIARQCRDDLRASFSLATRPGSRAPAPVCPAPPHPPPREDTPIALRQPRERARQVPPRRNLFSPAGPDVQVPSHFQQPVSTPTRGRVLAGIVVRLRAVLTMGLT